MINCETIMSRDLTVVFPHVTIDKVALTMRDSDIGAVPVVSDDGSNQLIGIVTDRDIAIRIVAEGKDATSIPVHAIMSRDVIVCGVETTLDDALYLMLNKGIRRVPVIDEKNTVVGLLSAADAANSIRPAYLSPEIVSAVARSSVNQDFEQARVQFEAEMDRKMAELTGKIDSIMLRMRVEASEMTEQVKSSDTYRELLEMREELEADIQTLKASSTQQWEELKIKVRDGWNRLSVKLEEACEAFSRSLSGSSR
ncbi:MAG: CBS domain-containing protein [Cyanobacteria bacterium HKST-UBA02]|nr:CBS domain-containing protein [Cyanobacteria bacterium HKST-UBA02]